MKHNLKISVSKSPRASDVVTCKNISMREHLLRFLFGTKRNVTILMPGDSVAEVTISDLRGGEKIE